ncbi:Benzoate 4-monooxygenase [Hirsutella minnesotensis 3608]|nr:Benzoate 4-monooxygenase [Hirsutella minnesotensis 3608]
MSLIYIYSLYLGIVALVAYYVILTLTLRYGRKIPGPFPAAFTNMWAMYHARRRQFSLAVDLAHQKYGKVIRIQPNHFSIADVNAIQVIYGHGNGFLKSNYYDAFASTCKRSIFNTRDRAEHTRKRRAVAHLFSAKSINQFEQYVQANTKLLVEKWSRKCAMMEQGDGKTSYACIDVMPWFGYLAFDIIGDLLFGAPFGMLSQEHDQTGARKVYDAPPSLVDAIDILDRQGEVNAALGFNPRFKPYVRCLPDPFFRHGVEAVNHMTGIAIDRIKSRLQPDVAAKNTRLDMLAKLQESTDDTGAKLGLDEIITESLTFLVAGSNSTASTLCALVYFVTSTPSIKARLQEAIGEVIPKDDLLPSFSQVKRIPYLQWVVNETLRFHSPFSLGFPREIPPGNLPIEICGHKFYPGDVLSVPTLTLHHSSDIWGSDADKFLPERWDPVHLTMRQKAAFIPFGVGPRACIGRNLAEMELVCIVAAVFQNFDFNLEPGTRLDTKEGFAKKPTGRLPRCLGAAELPSVGHTTRRTA